MKILENDFRDFQYTLKRWVPVSTWIEAAWGVIELWIRENLRPALIVTFKASMLGVVDGALDFTLFLALLSGAVGLGQGLVNARYTLPPRVQQTTLEWAIYAEGIGRVEDVPREVPLVLWYMESGMRQENPENCIGIIGAYDRVRSGDLPCFEPGPIEREQVYEQLQLGAQEFKLRCPEVSYHTADPNLLKKCYLAYNAGMSAAEVLDPDQSAYVMNNYDAEHQGMIYQDIELGTVTLQRLGAWPTHLAMQSLVLGNWDMLGGARRPLMWVETVLINWQDKFTDWDITQINILGGGRHREPWAESCLVAPHTAGRALLRPRLNPVMSSVRLTQDLHGCSYNLPGLDLSSADEAAPLQAPMPGQVSTFSDQWGNTTIQIENDEWIVWLLHPRSYFVEAGEVERGDMLGVMGAVGNATGPHVHYTIYDKIAGGFVDPGHFVPPLPN